EALLTAILVAAIVVGIHTVGAVPMVPLLITHAAACRQCTNRLTVLAVLAALLGAVSGAAGALPSATTTDLPTGPLIVLVATGIFLVSLPARALRTRLGARREVSARRAKGVGVR